MNKKLNFEEAFIKCLTDGVYPGPSNINERWRKDGLRLNKLNGQYTKERLMLMYLFGVPYQRGANIYTGSYSTTTHITGVPEWPYAHDLLVGFGFESPVKESRKHEIQDPDKPWKLRRK